MNNKKMSNYLWYLLVILVAVPFLFPLLWIVLASFKTQSQIVTSPKGGGRQYFPYVFTEQGVAMLSSVLKSKQAITVNVQIIRTFVKMRQFALTNKDLTKRLDEMEKRFIEYVRDMNINIEDIYKQLNYLTDITKSSQIGF